MAASIPGIFDNDLSSAVVNSKVLLVGAGGIGCEVLKNLVLSGFKDIEVIDLDTIEVSNLNRQFLFQKKHVGRSKAEVARESALSFNPDARITANHSSVMRSVYSVNYFKKFTVVLNALDNRAARNHVNRMCLAAEVPLVESGSAGYDGQVELIKKGLTECYECKPKAAQKTFPGCTIRNTPSEPIHCIVWAKHLFNQLFGEWDADNDVSPDSADPEAVGTAGVEALKNHKHKQKVSTRAWAEEVDYKPSKMFRKLFHDDIKYLLSMHNLWEKRRAPTPLNMDNLPDAVPGSSKDNSHEGLKDQRTWSIVECAKVFSKSITNLNCEFKRIRRLNPEGHLVWDKDDNVAMDFVAACANIRAFIFGIAQKSRFDIKSMAGNIIPAIATTNAIIAGLVVLTAFNILRERFEKCQSTYVRLKPNHRNQLIVPERSLYPPNEKCIVCRDQPKVAVCLDTKKMTVRELEECVLKASMNMIQPDVMKEPSGDVIISSEEGEMDNVHHKTLEEMGITDGTILSVDDFVQNYSLKVIINQRDAVPNAPDFEVVADPDMLKPQEEEANKNGEKGKEEDEEDLIMIEEVPEAEKVSSSADRKRKPDDPVDEVTPKKKRISDVNADGDDIIVL